MENQERKMRFFGFGEAPEAAKLGYSLRELVHGTEDEISQRFTGDLIAVKGAVLHDQSGSYEWAIMAKTAGSQTRNLAANGISVGDRVYFDTKDDPTLSGWYILHRVRTTSGKIETPDSWVTLCKENNQPGDYTTALASQIHKPEPRKVREGKPSPRFGARGLHNINLGGGSTPLLIKLYGPNDDVLATLTEEKGECIDPGYVDFFLGPNCRPAKHQRYLVEKLSDGTVGVLHDQPQALARDFEAWVAFLDKWTNRHEGTPFRGVVL